MCVALALAATTPSGPADIPTTAEAGLPGFTSTAGSLFAPAGTPPTRHRQAERGDAQVGRIDRAVQRSDQVGNVLKDWTAAEMDSFAKSEVAEWGKVIRDNNITMD
jgi:tripartite-type tricarboxylate transporter receptor subunit TctC